MIPSPKMPLRNTSQLVGGCANIHRSVVEDEVFQVDEFAVDPQRGAGVGEMRALGPSWPDMRSGHALVQTRKFDTGPKCRLQRGFHADFRNIVSH